MSTRNTTPEREGPPRVTRSVLGAARIATCPRRSRSRTRCPRCRLRVRKGRMMAHRADIRLYPYRWVQLGLFTKLWYKKCDILKPYYSVCGFEWFSTSLSKSAAFLLRYQKTASNLLRIRLKANSGSTMHDHERELCT